MIHPKEKKARDIEILTDQKVLDMINALKNPDVPEKMKDEIRARLKRYKDELETEIKTCTSKLNLKNGG